jgi:tetratricopeptide (TPR) repeat protein
MPKVSILFIICLLSLVFKGCEQPSADEYFSKGEAEFMAKNYSLSIGYFNKALTIKKDIEKAYYYRADAEFNLHNYIASVNDYNKAIELEPGNIDAYRFRGLAKYKNGDKQGACNDWNMALSKGNNRALHYIQLYCK